MNAAPLRLVRIPAVVLVVWALVAIAAPEPIFVAVHESVRECRLPAQRRGRIARQMPLRIFTGIERDVRGSNQDRGEHNRCQPPAEALKAQHLNDQNRGVLRELASEFAKLPWEREKIAAAIKDAIARHKLKAPQVMMPLRVLVAGRTNTPAIDAVLALVGRERTIARLERGLS